jgi:hypothetical protein
MVIRSWWAARPCRDGYSRQRAGFAQSFPERRLAGLGAHRFDLAQALLNLCLQFLAMVVVVAERRMNLSQGQVGMLKVDPPS